MLESIKIFDSVYTITAFDNKKAVNPLNSEENTLGYVDYNEKTIRIFASPSTKETEKTLLHEVLHILIRELRITEIQEDERAENIIDLLALGIITIITDNKLTVTEENSG